MGLWAGVRAEVNGVRVIQTGQVDRCGVSWPSGRIASPSPFPSLKGAGRCEEKVEQGGNPQANPEPQVSGAQQGKQRRREKPEEGCGCKEVRRGAWPR